MSISTFPRITARIDSETQALLTQAAAIAGLSSVNAFVLSAAVEKARNIMERERTLKLGQADAVKLIEALDRPAKPNPRLRQAAEDYRVKKQA